MRQSQPSRNRRSRRWRPVASLLPIVSILIPLAAAAQPDGYADVTDVVVVEVPVHVTRNGEPVRGLGERNFEIVVDRKKQKLLDFEVIDLAAIEGLPTTGQQALPVVARRHFLLLFDLSFARPAGIVRSQIAARRLVLDGLHPTDLVGVAVYSEATGASVVLGFTSDRRQIDLALATLGNLKPSERVRDPLGIVLADHRQLMELYGGFAYDLENSTPKDENPERSAGYETTLFSESDYLRNLKDMGAMSGIAARSQVRNQILALSSSFTELADHLAEVDGRKHVVYFSEGFDSASLVGTDDTQRIGQLNDEGADGQLWRIDSDERFGDVGTRQGVFEMLDHFKRCDCTIQAVDTRGVRDDSGFDRRAAGEDSLFIMANETGGELFRNYNDLSQAMESMLERTSLTYLLSFQAENVGEPGEYHPIRVKLKGGPKGARLVHRPGFYAPKPYMALSAEERRFRTLELMMEGREGGALDASLLALPFKASGSGADVLTLLEIEGYSLLRGHRGPVIPTEVFAYAIDEQGRVADFLGQAVELDLEKVRPALDSRGFKFLGRLQLDPGSYEVRVLVRNVLTGATGVRVARIEVPAFGENDSALLPPLFIEPEGTWLIGESQAEDAGDPAYPLTVGRRNLVPSARPFLKSNAAVPVLLVGYNLDPEGLSGVCRLVPVDGGEAVQMELKVQSRAQTETAGVERLAATIGPGGAPPGEYRLEVILRGSESGRTVTSAIPVRIY